VKTLGLVAIAASVACTACRDPAASASPTSPGSGTKSASTEVDPNAIAATDVSLQDDFGCYRGTDSIVRCWGRNSGGQVGDGTSIPDSPDTNVRATPVAVKGAPGDGALHTSPHLTWVIHADGSVNAWGEWIVTAGAASDQWSSLVPKRWKLPPVREIAFGSSFFCVLTVDGVVQCEGDGGRGGLGDGQSNSRATLGVATGVGKSTRLVAGDDNACALDAEGHVTCWGVAWGKDLGIDSEAPPPVSVRSGHAAPPPHPLAGPHHRVDRAPVRLDLPSAAVDIYAGFRSTCALLRDGSVWCWSSMTSLLPDSPAPQKVACAGPVKELADGCYLQVNGDVCCGPSVIDARYDKYDLARLRGATHLAVRLQWVCGIVKNKLRCTSDHGLDERSLFGKN